MPAGTGPARRADPLSSNSHCATLFPRQDLLLWRRQTMETRMGSCSPLAPAGTAK